MTARELFESALDAARQIARLEERLQIMRERIGVQGHGYEAHGKSGTLDPMRKVDDLVDWQAECELGLAECRKSLDEAYEVVAGIEAGGGHEMAEVLTRRYLMAEDVAHIAKSLGRSREWVVAAAESALALVDKGGIARLKDEGRDFVQ